jgi:hypothetical protein
MLYSILNFLDTLPLSPTSTYPLGPCFPKALSSRSSTAAYLNAVARYAGFDPARALVSIYYAGHNQIVLEYITLQ